MKIPFINTKPIRLIEPVTVADLIKKRASCENERKGKTNMRKNKIKDIETAIRIYYTHPQLSNKEIFELFGFKSNATAARYKKPVLEEMTKQGIPQIVSSMVDTETAYKVWGIDVKKLERNLKKLEAMRLAYEGGQMK